MSEASPRQVYLGVDVGSVSTNFILYNGREPSDKAVVWKRYLRTRGAPLEALRMGLKAMYEGGNWEVVGVGTTGSGRELAGVVLVADVVKNEITAHAIAALNQNRDVQTVIEIGGQDSKLIVIRNGVVVDFAMNTVCAAGTGSFLEQQAMRLGIPVDQLGSLALGSTTPVRIAGRCTVFAESDMIHKQQLGHSMEDIVAGLCSSMARNYLNNVAKGKELVPVVFFQGGVAANQGMRRALQDFIGCPVEVPEHFDVMGAIGAAILAKERLERTGAITKFVGTSLLSSSYRNNSYLCDRCPNQCEIVEIRRDGVFLAGWGARCGRTI